MGQKVNPIGLRLGVNRTWDSRWFADGDYAEKLQEDFQIRSFLKDARLTGEDIKTKQDLDRKGTLSGKEEHRRDAIKVREALSQAGISRVVVERPAKKARVTVYTARPGALIGSKGEIIEKLKVELQKLTKNEVSLNVVEVRKPEADAQLVADSIAQQLERRVSFRRAMKRSVQTALRQGAEGIRVNCAGRLGGAEIARTEWYREGRVPLHTLRADVDYGVSTAHTTYGACGIKVWIFKGEILAHDPMAQDKRMSDGQR